MAITFESLIEKAEREIRRDAEDLARLKSRYPGYDFLPTAGEAAITSTPSQRGLSPLEKAILDVMSLDVGKEWASRDVMSALRSGDAYRLATTDDAAMNAVSLALASLKESGNITRVHEGRGRDPHRYVVAVATEKGVHSEEQTP